MNRIPLLVPAVLLVAVATARGEEESRRVEVDLATCVRMALEANPALRAAATLPGIERTRVQEADAAFDQLLTFRGSAARSETPAASEFQGAAVLREKTYSLDVATTRRFVTGTTVSLGYRTRRDSTNSFYATLDPSWTSAFYLEVTQPLLRGGWREYNRSRVEAAKRSRDAARANLDGAVQDTILAVERAYWGLVSARSQVEVARASLGVAEEFLETTRRRIAAEKATRVEETQARTGVENRRLDLISAENRLGDARDRLRALLLPFRGEDREAVEFVPTESPTGPVEDGALPEDEAVRVAIERHPALRSTRQILRARETELRAAESETLPRLDLFGSARVSALDGDYGDTWDPLVGGDYPGWEIGVSLEIPLGNRAARSRRRRAELELRRQRSLLDQRTSDVVVEVRSALRGLRSASQSIQAAERARTLAREQLDNEQARLRAGVSTPFQVLQVEEDLTNARSREIEARTSLRIARAAYERAIGVLADRYGVVPRSLEIR